VITYYNYLVLFISTVTNNLQLQCKISILGTIEFSTVIFKSDVAASAVRILYTIHTNMNPDDRSLKLYIIIVLCLMYILYKNIYIHANIRTGRRDIYAHTHTRMEYNNSNTSLSSLSLLNSVSVKSCPFSIEFLLYLLRLYI